MVSAAGAGVSAGVVAALLQFWLLVPVIGAAELYESGERVHFTVAESGPADSAAPDHGGADHADDHAHGVGEMGLGRHAGTLVFTLATYIGFSLLLVAGFALAARAGGIEVSARDGLVWGLGGFAATQLMPGLGLPPELPGSAAADLSARQAWWLLTVVCTAAGLSLLVWLSGAAKLAGVALVAVPHLIAAPHPEVFGGVTPPEMAAQFAARALGVGAIAWAVLGWTAGYLWHRNDAAT